MSKDDDDDDIKPPAHRTTPPPVPARRDGPPMVPKVGGVVDAAMTGWRARSAAKSYRDIRDALDATTGAVSSGIGLKRELDRLADLDNILDEDQKQRDHERWMAEQAREAARVSADYNLETLVARNEAEMALAKTDAIHKHRWLITAEKTKDMYIESAVHKVGTENHNREVKYLTAKEAARRRREQLAGISAPQPTGVFDPDLLQMIDNELRDAHAQGDPVEVIIRLGNLKTAAFDIAAFVAAIEEQLNQSTAAGEPCQVQFRLASVRAAFQEK